MQWYYAIDGQRLGPVAQAELEKLVTDGVVKAETLVWRQGMSEWQPYAQAGAGQAAPPAVTGAGDDGTEACAVSGKRFPRREMVNFEGKWIGAEHRDEFFQRQREGVPQPGPQVVPGPFGYGRFLQRFCARFLDGLITGVVGMLIGAVIGAIFGAAGLLKGGDRMGLILLQVVVQLASMGLVIGYEIYFLRKFDATPGKMALGLKVLRADGSKLTVGRIVGRYYAAILSALPLLIGFIMAGFDEEGRTLHDRICDTRVVKTK
jgi:uncharacterized RDD family membrane protein YckC